MNWIYLFAFIALCCAAWSWALLRSSARLTPTPSDRQKDPAINHDQYTRERLHGLLEFQKVQPPKAPPIVQARASAANYFTRDLEGGELPKSRRRP